MAGKTGRLRIAYANPLCQVERTRREKMLYYELFSLEDPAPSGASAGFRRDRLMGVSCLTNSLKDPIWSICCPSTALPATPVSAE